MSFKSINNHGESEQRFPLGSLLRAEADGELTSDQARVLEQRRASGVVRAEDAARLAFERGLRQAVSRVLADSPEAPADLLERIKASLAQRSTTTKTHAFASEAPIAFPASSLRWGRLAAAAAVLLTLGAGLMMLTRGPSITSSPMSSSPGASHIITSEQATHLISYIADQHEHCANFGVFFNNKMTARTEADATAAAIELLSKVPSVLELGADRLAQAGYEFAGLGRCRVPGPGRSAHLVYKTHRPDSPAVSLFIQEDRGDLVLEPDRYYSCTGEMAEKETLTLWRKDGLIYYLFTPDPQQQPLAREVFGAPIRRASLM